MEKINIIKESNTKIRERLILIRMDSPYIFQRNFERIVRKKIRENFDDPKLESLEDHFLKFIKNPNYSFYVNLLPIR
jgi:hypothetical protein